MIPQGKMMNPTKGKFKFLELKYLGMLEVATCYDGSLHQSVLIKDIIQLCHK